MAPFLVSLPHWHRLVWRNRSRAPTLMSSHHPQPLSGSSQYPVHQPQDRPLAVSTVRPREVGQAAACSSSASIQRKFTPRSVAHQAAPNLPSSLSAESHRNILFPCTPWIPPACEGMLSSRKRPDQMLRTAHPSKLYLSTKLGAGRGGGASRRSDHTVCDSWV